MFPTINNANFDQLTRRMVTRRNTLRGLAGLALGLSALRLNNLAALADERTITVSDGLALSCVEGCDGSEIQQNSNVTLDDYDPEGTSVTTSNEEVSNSEAACFGEDCGHPLRGPEAYTSGLVIKTSIAAASTGKNSNLVKWHARIPAHYVLLLDGVEGHVAHSTYHWEAGGVAAIQGPDEFDFALVDGSLWMVHETVAKVEACSWWADIQSKLHGRLYLPTSWGDACHVPAEDTNAYIKAGDEEVDVFDGADYGLDETSLDGACITFDAATPIADRTYICSGQTVVAGYLEYDDGTSAEGCYITLERNAWVTDGIGASIPEDIQEDLDAALNGVCVSMSA